MEDAYLIVGLGNPGPEYAQTRHNAGFRAVDCLAQRWALRWRTETRLDSRLAIGHYAGKRVCLCQPQTFMNASGEAVARVVGYYRIALEHTLVISDDADLPVGELRMRPGGGTGGHHGLESVQAHLGTQNYARLRVGIGRRADGLRQIAGHVLGRLDRHEIERFEKVLERAADQAQCWVDAGIQKAMNQFNGTLQVPEQEATR